MLIKLLSYLFRRDTFVHYEAHPIHVVWAILIMAMGTVTYTRDGWGWFGGCSFVVGLALAITIILAINWQKSIDYWETINSHVDLMRRTPNPALWRALGYEPSPAQIVIEEKKYDDYGSLSQIKKNYVPVSPEIMKQISNKALTSGDLTFSEPKYSRLVSNFRKVQKQWRKEGILKPNLIKNGKEISGKGYSFTRKGVMMLYEYADEMIKRELKKGEENGNGT